MSALTVTPSTPAIGAEISGVDLNEPLSASVQDAIYQALIDHQVIFFRDQEIGPAGHQAFAETFGQLDQPHPVYPHVDGFENIVELASGESNPPDADSWHTDLTFRDNPPFASILVARHIPPCGGDTLWTSLYAAYDALPDDMKSHVEGMTAVHDMGGFRNRFTIGETSGAKLTAAMQRFGCAIHELVKTHPITNRKFLYVNEGFTRYVVGMTPRQSRRFLNYLLDHISRPEHQVRFRWNVGDLAMWDNRCTQHYATADYLPHFRCMNRITVINDRRAWTQETMAS